MFKSMKAMCKKIQNFFFINLLAKFLLSSEQVNLIPHGETNGVVGGNASFTCIPSTNQQYFTQWIINGNRTHFPDNACFMNHSGVGTLDFYYLNLQNNASIQCVAYNELLKQESISNEVILQVSPGFLGPVGSLNVTALADTLLITWTPPPVIGALDYDPSSTTYCVQLFNSMELECGINMTMFEIRNSWCHIFFIIVTPHNNVAGDGMERRLQYKNHIAAPQVLSATVSNESVMVSMSAAVCNVSVTLVDVVTKTNTVLRESDLDNIMENNITFSTQLLNEARCYNVSVTASNTAGHATSNTDMPVCTGKDVPKKVTTLQEITSDHPEDTKNPPKKRLELIVTIPVVVAVVAVVVVLILALCSYVYYRKTTTREPVGSNNNKDHKLSIVKK